MQDLLQNSECLHCGLSIGRGFQRIQGCPHLQVTLCTPLDLLDHIAQIAKQMHNLQFFKHIMYVFLLGDYRHVYVFLYRSSSKYEKDVFH